MSLKQKEKAGWNMSRPKGALNKRTRTAMAAAAEGRLGKDADRTIESLLRVANDESRDVATRTQAANAALPYVKPRLAAVEQTNIDPGDTQTEADILAKLRDVILHSPTLVEQVVTIALELRPDVREKLRLMLDPSVPAQAEVLAADAGRLH
jgi:hypothetical protein